MRKARDGQRSWILVSMAALVVAEVAASPAATREDLQRAMAQLQEVTNQYFDHPRSAKVRSFIDEGHGQIRTLAGTAPDARRIAQVILRQGVDPRHLQAMTREFHLSVHEIELVFTLEGERDYANTLPSQLLWGSRMPVRAVIDQFIADHRVEFLRIAEKRNRDPNPNAAAGAAYFAAMAKSGRPLLVRARVTASADMLRLISEEPEIYAVIMNPSAESARRLEEARIQAESPTAIQDITEL
jgi:hypothetical protein